MARSRPSATDQARDRLPKAPLNRETIGQALELMRYVRPYRTRFLGGLATLFISASMGLAFPYLSGGLIDAALHPELAVLPVLGQVNLNQMALLLLGAVSLQALCSFNSALSFNRVGQSALADLRRDEQTRQVGVILLTARKEEQDRIAPGSVFCWYLVTSGVARFLVEMVRIEPRLEFIERAEVGCARVLARDHRDGLVDQRREDDFLGLHEQRPGIDFGRERLECGRHPIVVLDDDYLEGVACDVLLAEIMQQVKAFAHAPVDEDQAEARRRPRALLEQLHRGAAPAARCSTLRQAMSEQGS